MPMMTPQEFREKQARRLKGAVTDIQNGVNRVTEAPGKKAAQKQEKMKQRLNEKIDDGTWAQRVAAVSTEEWKEKMLTKGVGRIASGIDAAAGKVEAFAEQFLPHVAAVQAKVNSMPDLTIEDGINRMVENVRGMAKFRKK